MAKKLACRLGRPDWTTRVEGGESYKVGGRVREDSTRLTSTGIEAGAAPRGGGEWRPTHDARRQLRGRLRRCGTNEEVGNGNSSRIPAASVER